MILLLGGTSDTSPIARQLAECGYRVLISRATEIPLATVAHPRIESRSGRLDERSLVELVDQRQILAIVDATHPYAVAIGETARRVAAQKGIPCVRFVRPASVDAAAPGVEFAPDHTTAAAMAFRSLRPVLLTTGTKNLVPYAAQARQTGIPLIVRTLDQAPSLEACRRAGIPPEHVIAGRGPFSVEENRRHLQRFGIGVLVTKDSGAAGGTLEKLQAARIEGCRVIVVARPVLEQRTVFTEVATLIEAARCALAERGRCNE